jgi:hypothetical protein
MENNPEITTESLKSLNKKAPRLREAFNLA